MPTFINSWGGPEPPYIDMPTFNRQLQARWGVTATRVTLDDGPYPETWTFSLPHYPLTPVRDDAMPSKVGWLPIPRIVVDPQAPGGFRWLPELDHGTIACALFPESGGLSFSGADHLDLAVYAIRVRRVLPADVRVEAGNEDMSLTLVVTPSTTIEDVVLRLASLRPLSDARNTEFGIGWPCDFIPSSEADDLFRRIALDVLGG